MSKIHLIAASDDYLLEERLSVAVAELCEDLGGVEPEIQTDEATPESVATELVSPSLFASQRVIVVNEARVKLEIDNFHKTRRFQNKTHLNQPDSIIAADNFITVVLVLVLDEHHACNVHSATKY